MNNFGAHMHEYKLFILVYFLSIALSDYAHAHKAEIPNRLRGCWQGISDRNETIEIRSNEYFQGDGRCEAEKIAQHRISREFKDQWFIVWLCENGDEKSKPYQQFEILSTDRIFDTDVLIRYGSLYDQKKLMTYIRCIK